MKLLTTAIACVRLGLPETTLRHVLRKPDAPRPELHPTARVFLWTETDVERLAAFIAQEKAPRARKEARADA